MKKMTKTRWSFNEQWDLIYKIKDNTRTIVYVVRSDVFPKIKIL